MVRHRARDGVRLDVTCSISPVSSPREGQAPMPSAVPLVHRLFPSEDAVLRIDPATGEPLQLLAHPRVDGVTRRHLLDLVAALDFAVRLEERPAHGPSTPVYR